MTENNFMASKHQDPETQQMDYSGWNTRSQSARIIEKHIYLQPRLRLTGHCIRDTLIGVHTKGFSKS